MKTYTLLFFAFLITACSGIRISSPNPRVEPPKLRGAEGFRFHAEAVGSHTLQSTDSPTSRPLDLEQPTVESRHDVFSGAAYAFHPRLQAGAELSPLTFGFAGFAQWQPLGTASRRPIVEDLPLSFYVRVGKTDSSSNSDQLEHQGARSKMSESYAHTGVSLGYQYSPLVLLYGGAAFGVYQARAEVHQVREPQGDYSSSYEGRGITAGLGALLKWKLIQCYVSGEWSRRAYQLSNVSQSLFVHTGVVIEP